MRKSEVACLEGRHLMITSGPTRAPVDAVRYLTNKSSGRLGSMLALEALRHGARVTFVYGRDSLTPAACGITGDSGQRIRLVEVETVSDLLATVRAELPGGYDAIIHAIAVLDFEPESFPEQKTPSDRPEWVIRLRPTPKVIAEMRELAPRAVLVGFKLVYNETPEEIDRIAAESVRRYRGDFVLANDLAQIEQGRHIGHLIDGTGQVVACVEGKREIAETVIGAVARRLTGRA
jgi:phosphopantothenoylcysteine synthetase/decarboxylase